MYQDLERLDDHKPLERPKRQLTKGTKRGGDYKEKTLNEVIDDARKEIRSVFGLGD
ncbi:MAG: hypothetical protein P1U88_23040 [Thalassobaculaceae bacterium]|nr:hypothetical protein [Thalassobaculaceae bacterium]